MRIGALLLVGLGFVFAAACTANTSADLVCESGGGTCIALPDGNLPSTCGEQMSGLACDPGYVCCVVAAAGAGTADGAPAATPAAKTTDAATGG